MTLESTSESKNESTVTDLTNFSTNKISIESNATDVNTRETFNTSTKLETNQATDVANPAQNVTTFLANISMETNVTEFSTANVTTKLPSVSNSNSTTYMIGLTSVSVKDTVTDLSVEKTSEVDNILTDESFTPHSSTFETTNNASEKYETSNLNSFESSSSQTTPANLLFELSTINVDSNTSETFFNTFKLLTNKIGK